MYVKKIFPKNHFLGVVFNGESHGDIHFNSKRRRYTVLIANSSQAVCTPCTVVNYGVVFAYARLHRKLRLENREQRSTDGAGMVLEPRYKP